MNTIPDIYSGIVQLTWYYYVLNYLQCICQDSSLVPNPYVNESIQSRSVRLNPVQSGPVQFTWYYTLSQCIRSDGLQITWYHQVPWANPAP